MKRLLACLLLLAPLAGCGLFRVRPPVYPALELGLGLVARDLVVPDEGPTAKAGDRVTIDYWIRLAASGKMVDSSTERGQPITFVLKPGAVFPGLVRGIPGMRERGSRRLYVPAELAYGAAGLPPRIPPASDLSVEVELLELHQEPVEEPTTEGAEQRLGNRDAPPPGRETARIS